MYTLLLKSRRGTGSDGERGGASEAVNSGRVWSDFCDSLKDAGQIVLTTAQTERDRVEGYRHLTRLIRGGLENYVENSDVLRPKLRPLPYNVKLGADNPSNNYFFTNISGAHEYRITGTRGTVNYFSIGAYEGVHPGRFEKAGKGRAGFLNDNEIRLTADGHMTLHLSQVRPDPLPDHVTWLPLSELTERLVVRQTFLDRASEQGADLTIERIATPGSSSTDDDEDPATAVDMSADRLVAVLSGAAMFVNGAADQFAKWSLEFAQRPNTLKELDEKVSKAAWADPNLRIFHGYWTLAGCSGDDAAVVIVLRPPADCSFWNFQLDNVWMESLDYEQHQVFVDGRTAVPVSSHAYVVICSARDPKIAGTNWLDTGNRQHGTFAYRLVYPESPETPTVQSCNLRSPQFLQLMSELGA